MKQNIILFIMLFCSLSVMAIDMNGRYGINSAFYGYQQYVGQKFKVREPLGERETWRGTGFKYSKDSENKTYIISGITKKKTILNGRENELVTIEAVEVESNKRVSIKAYTCEESRTMGNGKCLYYPKVDRLPLYFSDQFQALINEKKGTIVSFDVVKESYKIIDIGFSAGDETALLSATLVNLTTNKEVTVSYYNRYEELFGSAIKGKYCMVLNEVERPQDSSVRYGETVIDSEDGVTRYNYNDSIIDITIVGSKRQFDFSLMNMSKSSIKVIWNESAYVDLDGVGSKLIHGGISLKNTEVDQPSTTIIKGSKLDDNLVPTNNIYYSEEPSEDDVFKNSGFKIKPILPQNYIGKEPGFIRLMLPIQVKDVVNEYTFVFKVYYKFDHPELIK